MSRPTTRSSKRLRHGAEADDVVVAPAALRALDTAPTSPAHAVYGNPVLRQMIIGFMTQKEQAKSMEVSKAFLIDAAAVRCRSIDEREAQKLSDLPASATSSILRNSVHEVSLGSWKTLPITVRILLTARGGTHDRGTKRDMAHYRPKHAPESLRQARATFPNVRILRCEHYRSAALRIVSPTKTQRGRIEMCKTIILDGIVPKEHGTSWRVPKGYDLELGLRLDDISGRIQLTPSHDSLDDDSLFPPESVIRKLRIGIEQLPRDITKIDLSDYGFDFEALMRKDVAETLDTVTCRFDLTLCLWRKFDIAKFESFS